MKKKYWVLATALGLPLTSLSDRAYAQRSVQQASAEQSERAPQHRTRTPGAAAQRTNPGGSQTGDPAIFPVEFRTIDGSHNNARHIEWGAAEEAFVRRVRDEYADGVSAPAGAQRPNVRDISNQICAQSELIYNTLGASDFVWAWGQFLDHDITETPLAAPAEAFDIQVPLADPSFDPNALGTVLMPLDRSSYEMIQGRREQVNAITAYIDGSQIYGSDAERALWLRTLDGTGRLKTSAGDLLPYNTGGLHNAPSDSPTLFVAGDIRANEQVLLTVLHTVFVREHNYWAGVLQTVRPLDGDAAYEWARAIVTAELQAITYREFLPVLLGPGTLPAYEGYREDRRASIQNLFATAAFRFGHTMLPLELQRKEADGSDFGDGPLSLAQAFFRPDRLVTDGLEPYLRGAASQVAQDIDPYVVDSIRNFLFGAPGQGGLDLASLNLQRGRDHGLPSIQRVRRAFGLPPIQSLSEWAGPGSLGQALEDTFGSAQNMDPWVGFLSERKDAGELVPPTLKRVLTEQFTNLRDGDRFYYESYLTDRLAYLVETQTLAVILRRNTDIGDELQANVFLVP